MKPGQHQEFFLLGLLAMLCLGIGMAWHFRADANIVCPAAALAVLALAAAWGIRQERPWTWLCFGLAAFLLGGLRLWMAWALPAEDISCYAREEITVTGSLSEAPLSRRAADGTYRLRLTLAVEQVQKARSAPQPASGKLYVYCPMAEEPAADWLLVGDRVKASGKVRLPHGYQNPGQLDTALLLRSQGITATLSAQKRSLSVESVDTAPFSRWLVKVRQHYLQAMQRVMPREDAAAIFAMLFGGYQDLQPELLAAFTATGLIHLLSVSGSHISLIAAVMAWLGLMLHLPKALRVALVLGTIAIYSLLAGCVPPVIRSAVMGALAFLALALDREREARRILLLTGLVMLTISPLLLFHISFQLSFLATAGLLYLAPVLGKWLEGFHLGPWLSTGLAITLAAQLSTLPVLAWYFNQLSISSLLANLTIVPLVELIIVLGLFAGLLAFLLPFLGGLAYAADSLLLGLVYELSRWMASLPGSQIWLPSMGWGAVVIYYAMLSVPVMDEVWRNKILEWIGARRQQMVLLLLAALVFAVSSSFSKADELTLSVVDVGQGDAVVLHLPHGRALLFDTGGTRDGEFDIGARVLVPYLRHYGIQEVAAIFLTHAHADHAGGAGAVLKSMPVGAVYTADEGRDAYAQAMRIGSADPLLQKLHPVQEGAVFEIDGVRIEVVYAPVMPAQGQETGNEASNVYRIVYGQASFLITGDLIKDNEQVILKGGKSVHSTVLKVGHHGSDSSSSREFLQAVAPSFAVISVGANNSFGHPRQEVLDRLQESGIEVFRTDRDGEIKFCTDGKTMRVEKYVE